MRSWSFAALSALQGILVDGAHRLWPATSFWLYHRYLQVAVKPVMLVIKSLTVLWCWNMLIMLETSWNSFDIQRFAQAQVCPRSRPNPRWSQRLSQNGTHQQSNEGHSMTFGDLPRHLIHRVFRNMPKHAKATSRIPYIFGRWWNVHPVSQMSHEISHRVWFEERDQPH
jgi:hypothetical protein